MALDDFLKKERTGGKAVGGEAAFTLDPVKVRERVAVFCRQHSLYPLLRSLQALVRVSRGDIFGTKKGELVWEFRFRWDGCPPTEAFEQLLNLGVTSGFDEVGHRVGQHFFFGMSAALGTDNYELTWRGPQAHFKLRKGEFKAAEPVAEEYTSLSLTTEASWWEKLTRASAFRSEEEDLCYRLGYSPTPIHFNGKRLEPEVPEAPDRPWAARLMSGSELAWRFIKKADQNMLTIPYPELDYYRSGKSGEAFHLVRDTGGKKLPLSVYFHDPDRHRLKPGQTQNLSLSQSNRAHTALFLSLDAGRQDWVFPVCDGVLCSPVEADISGGGIVCLTSEQSLQYDISGLNLVKNNVFEQFCQEMKRETRVLKKQLAISLANIGVRADRLPDNYEQALGYLTGGPYLGFLGGRVGPKLRRLFGKEETS